MHNPRNPDDPTMEDGDLKARFQALREREARGAPAFETLMKRARAETEGSHAGVRSHGAEDRPGMKTGSAGNRQRILRRLGWAGSLLAAAAVAALLLVRSPGTSEEEFVQVVQHYTRDPAAGAWKSPTDALLQVPGRRLLSSVPTIKTSRWMVAPLPPSRRNPS